MNHTDVNCPDCGKLLFRAHESLNGSVLAWCRQCKSEKCIEISQGKTIKIKTLDKNKEK